MASSRSYSSSLNSIPRETTAAVGGVELLDASHGVLGELIDPSLVLQGLRLSDNVGQIDDPQAALATQAMHSFTATTKSVEIPIEFDNATCHAVRVRWMDEQGNATLVGTIDPFSQLMQYSRCGHLFVFSAVVLGVTMSAAGGGGGATDDHTCTGTATSEQLLGAYRIRRQCPSGSPHQLLIEQQQEDDGEEASDDSVVVSATEKFKLEALIADATGQDELVVAAAVLDDDLDPSSNKHANTTIKTLYTVVSNLLSHPDDPKYQTLKSSNPKVQSALLSNYAARQMLYNIGFREEEEEATTSKAKDDEEEEQQQQQRLPVWKYQPNSNLHAVSARLLQAKELLDVLLQRSQPGFVAELAPPPIWQQGPILNSSHVNANTRGFGGSSDGGTTHFLSDDEKWARAERNRQRRGRAGRRPDPGNAPSSKGKWGR